MLLNMNIVEAAGMICQDMAYATAAKGLGRDYELMYQDAWGFEYGSELHFKSLNPTEYNQYEGLEKKEQEGIKEQYRNALGRKVTGGDADVCETLRNYHGIQVVYKNAVDSESYWEMILQELKQGFPVDMWFDQYYMPWTKAVRKKAPLRYQGYLMMIGYDEKVHMIQCIDIHGTRKQEEMPLSVFREFMKEHQRFAYTTYRLQEKESEFDVKSFLERTVARVNGKCPETINIFEEMRRLAKDVKEHFSFQDEIDLSHATKGTLAAPTHILCAKSFTEVSRMRNLFSLSLEYIAKKEGVTELLEIADRFKLHATKWQMLTSVLGKVYYKKDFVGLSEQLAEHIIKIAEEEEETAKRLEQLLKEYEMAATLCKEVAGQEQRKEVERKVEGQNVFCDITAFMNNKGFALDEKNAWNADFDGLGNYLLLDETLKQEVCYIDEQVFRIYTNQESKDNICCMGQSIPVPLDNYQSISLLGASDSGAFYGQIEIMYDDETKDEIILGFGEWRFGKCEFGEKLAWQGNRVYWNVVSQDERGYLFRYQVNLKKQRKVKSIKLPDCSNIHIFSITLGK